MAHLLERMKRFLFSQETMIFHDFYLDGLELSSKSDEGVVVEQLKPENVNEIIPVLEIQKRNETLFTPSFDVNGSLERMSRGDLCFFLKVNGKMINYVWFSPNDRYIPEIQCTLKIRPGEFYAYNAYVVPEFRGNNFHVHVHNHARFQMMKAGYTREIIARMDWNAHADHVLQRKLNTRIIGSVTVGFFLSLRYVIKNLKDVELIDEAGPFEFYKKFFWKIKNLSWLNASL